MEREYDKEFLIKHLLEALSKSKDEILQLKQTEINLLQELLIENKKIDLLLLALAEKTLSQPVQKPKKETKQ